ncbi:MAG: cupin domain-containing protein [Acidobacteriota bacterium]
MDQMVEGRSFSLNAFLLTLFLAFCFVPVKAQLKNTDGFSIVPLDKMTSEKGVEKVWGDMDVAGQPFIIRIHADAGYMIMPHVHPFDENITIVQGSWAFAMGSRFDMSALQLIEVGGFGFGPKNMAHFAYSKTESIVQVHGIGPFSSKLVDPVYQLNDKGTFVMTYLLRPGAPTATSPADCFALKIGARVRGDKGEGTVVEARCSPANEITQYWVRKTDGQRFWATFPELKPV